MDQYKNLLVVRADASTQTGTGHVMRCLALAQAWQDSGGRVTFVMAPGARTLEERIVSEGMEIAPLISQPGSEDDADETCRLARNMSACWVVLDGYHFNAAYQRTIKDAGLRCLFIDDNGHADHYYSDFVLNQNLHAHGSLYVGREPYTRLLLGARYALLRREFLKWTAWKRDIPVMPHKLLVSLGGGDPDNVTLKVIEALQEMGLKDLETTVIVGENNPHYEELESAVRNVELTIKLRRNVVNMPQLMAWADVAIASGGSTCWELMLLGLTTFVIVLANNQRSVAEYLDKHGVAKNLGWHSDLSPEDIRQALLQLIAAGPAWFKMSQVGRCTVDGYGCQRVIGCLLTSKEDDSIRP